jgi:hypothetical protein
MKIESADGVEGILIWCGGDRYVFRVYTAPPEEFVDYDIYTDGTDARVDHAPATLGINL